MKNGLQESGWIKEVRMDYRSKDGLREKGRVTGVRIFQTMSSVSKNDR